MKGRGCVSASPDSRVAASSIAAVGLAQRTEHHVRVQVTGRHTQIPDDVKEYAEAKMEPLGRFNRHARSLEIILDADHLSKLVECIAHLDRGAPLVVHAKHEDWRASVDLAVDKLETSFRRMKERIDDRQRGEQRRRARASEGTAMDVSDDTGSDDTGSGDTGAGDTAG